MEGQSPAFAKWPEKLVSHLGAKMAQKGAETLSSTPPGPEKWGSPLALGESTPKISPASLELSPQERTRTIPGGGEGMRKRRPQSDLKVTSLAASGKVPICFRVPKLFHRHP